MLPINIIRKYALQAQRAHLPLLQIGTLWSTCHLYQASMSYSAQLKVNWTRFGGVMAKKRFQHLCILDL